MRIIPLFAIRIALTVGGIAPIATIQASQENQPLPAPRELAPAPRPSITAVQLFPAPGGFQIALSRPAAEVLRDVLDTGADEKQIAKLLRENARMKRETAGEAEALTAARLELIAFVVSTQLPAFKKALHDRMGTNGVVVQVMGLQREKVFRKPRPILEAGLKIAVQAVTAFTPEEVGRTLEAVRSMARTTPLSWSVLPQE